MKHFNWDFVQGYSGVDDSWLEHRREDIGYGSINKVCYFEQCCLLACLLSHNVARIIIATAHKLCSTAETTSPMIHRQC